MSTRSGMQRSVRYLTKYKHARNMYKNRVRFVKGPVPFQGKFFFFSLNCFLLYGICFPLWCRSSRGTVIIMII